MVSILPDTGCWRVQLKSLLKRGLRLTCHRDSVTVPLIDLGASSSIVLEVFECTVTEISVRPS
jgi:hypothetical protein